MKKAFTHSEMLITLGIIGTVAALTIPTMIANNRYAEIQTSLIKNYTLTQQALQFMSQDEGYTIKADFGNLILHKYLRKYYKLGEICGNIKTNKKNTLCRNVSYKTFNGSTYASTTFFDDGSFATADGMLYMFENAGGGNKHTTYITIDVNSVKKLPNKWGHDLFTFQLTNDGKLLPMGADGTHYTNMETYCSENSSNNLNGIACTHRAFTETDYFKKLR